MEAFFVSTGFVALAEMGDKTQLLALLLVARFRRATPIILGILVATLANHALAGWLGQWIPQVISPQALRWLLGLSFLGIAAWLLIPDQFDTEPERLASSAWGIFAVTTAAFFMAEMGDKTQIATVALAARYAMEGTYGFVMVVLGTTLGMMLANVPVVLLGERLMRRLPVQWLQRAAALGFGLMGIAVLANLGG